MRSGAGAAGRHGGGSRGKWARADFCSADIDAGMVENLIDARDTARAARDFDTADDIRQVLQVVFVGRVECGFARKILNLHECQVVHEQMSRCRRHAHACVSVACSRCSCGACPCRWAYVFSSLFVCVSVVCFCCSRVLLAFPCCWACVSVRLSVVCSWTGAWQWMTTSKSGGLAVGKTIATANLVLPAVRAFLLLDHVRACTTAGVPGNCSVSLCLCASMSVQVLASVSASGFLSMSGCACAWSASL